MLVFILIGGDHMGLFNFFKKREDTGSSTAVDTTTTTEPISDILLKALLDGETIDKSKALSLPAVSSAVDEISNAVAMCPIGLYKQVNNTDGKKNVEEIKETDDVRVKILNSSTGDTLDSFQLKKAIVKDYLTDKGAYVYIEKEKNQFKSVRYVDATQIGIIKNADPIFKDIKYLVYGKEYETFNFLTILRSTKDGGSGTSVISEVSKAIETAYTTILYELGLVKKGGAKKGFLSASKKLGHTEINALKTAWQNLYSNSSENVIVLNDGLKFEEGASSSVELQVNERKKTLKEDIKDIFHMNDNYDTFCKKAVMPIIKAIESALNRDFLLEKEKGSFYFAFDTKELTRGDMKARYEAYKIASETGWLSKNEIRYTEDYDAIDGLDVISLGLGDVLFDIKTKTYYTPNTGEKANMAGGDNNETTN